MKVLVPVYFRIDLLDLFCTEIEILTVLSIRHFCQVDISDLRKILNAMLIYMPSLGKSEDCRLWFTAKVRPAELPTGQESVTEHYRLGLKRWCHASPFVSG